MNADRSNQVRLARWVGLSWLATIVVGIAASVFVSHGIDVNLTADAGATATNMMDAEMRLHAKAYVALLVFALEVFAAIGMFLLLKPYSQVINLWSAVVSVSGAATVLAGAVLAMTAAQVIGNPFFDDFGTHTRLMLVALQTTSDYTSFHLGLIVSTAAKVGVFYLLLRSELIPTIIAGWGLFASLFVVTTMLARDFIPVLGVNAVTFSFMIANLIALVSTALYFTIKGVRQTEG